MKKYIALALVAGFGLMSMIFAPTGNDSLALGKTLPKEGNELYNPSTKKEVNIADFKGENGTLIIFSCNTCPFVVAWEDRYNDLHGLAANNKIGSVLVNSNEAKRKGDDSEKEMLEHYRKQGYTMPYLMDNNHELADALGAKTTPHVFLFDGNNKLVYRGAIDDNFKDKEAVTKTYLADALKQLGTGAEIETKSTPAKGCSIKRIAK
jgi:hypothetical protein